MHRDFTLLELFPHPRLCIFLICWFAFLLCSLSIIAIYSLPIKADEHERKQLIYAYIHRSQYLTVCFGCWNKCNFCLVLFGFCVRLLSAVLFAPSFVFLFSTCTLRFPFDFCCAKQTQILIFGKYSEIKLISFEINSLFIRTFARLSAIGFFLLFWFGCILRILHQYKIKMYSIVRWW